jgi:serine/threonine-protein kinase RsbW
MADVESIRLELASNGRDLDALRSRIEGLLSDPRVSSDVSQRVQLAVHEVCANIVEHAYGSDRDGTIQVTLTRTFEPQRLVVDLFDTGLPFDPASEPEPNLDEPHVRGYGLYIVRSVMDDVRYDHGAGGNHWRLVKNL